MPRYKCKCHFDFNRLIYLFNAWNGYSVYVDAGNSLQARFRARYDVLTTFFALEDILHSLVCDCHPVDGKLDKWIEEKEEDGGGGR